MNRRSVFATIASVFSMMLIVPKVFAAASARPPQTDDEALDLLKSTGIVREDMTWDRMEAISRELGFNKTSTRMSGGSSGSSGGSTRAWTLIVKGKWIWKDDAKK